MKKVIIISNFKRTVFFLILLLLIAFLVQCIALPSSYSEMVCLASSTIPGYELGQHDDLRILEYDDYGRYIFTVEHALVGVKEAVIIVQRDDTKNGKVFYYSGYSTLLVDDVYHLSDEIKAQIEFLKVQNDWNQPLHEDKMSVLYTK